MLVVSSIVMKVDIEALSSQTLANLFTKALLDASLKNKIKYFILRPNNTPLVCSTYLPKQVHKNQQELIAFNLICFKEALGLAHEEYHVYLKP